MDKEKVKTFAKDILRQCESKGFTVTEVNNLPRMIEWALVENSQNGNYGEKSFKVESVIDH